MFRIKHPLRANDFDIYGHLNQSVYHVLLEEARIAYVFGRLPLTFQFVLVHVELDYLREIQVGEREVEMGVATRRVGESSFELEQKVWRADGELSAQGSSTFVAWDPEGRRSRPLTEAERTGLLAEASVG